MNLVGGEPFWFGCFYLVTLSAVCSLINRSIWPLKRLSKVKLSKQGQSMFEWLMFVSQLTRSSSKLQLDSQLPKYSFSIRSVCKFLRIFFYHLIIVYTSVTQSQMWFDIDSVFVNIRNTRSSSWSNIQTIVKEKNSLKYMNRS